MTWSTVARATAGKLVAERWFAISLVFGAAVLILTATSAVFSSRATTGLTIVSTTSAAVSPMVALFALLATATDPVDAPAEPRGSRVSGALIGTFAVAVAPLLAAWAVATLALLFLAGEAGTGILLMIVALVPISLMGGAWAALGLLVTGRCVSTGRAIASAAAAYGAVKLVLPLVLATLLGIYIQGRSITAFPPWVLVFTYLDPSSLQERVFAVSTTGVARQFAEFPSFFYNRYALMLGLLAWVFVPLSLAVARAPAPEAPAPPAPPPESPPESPPEVVI